MKEQEKKPLKKRKKDNRPVYYIRYDPEFHIWEFLKGVAKIVFWFIIFPIIVFLAILIMCFG